MHRRHPKMRKLVSRSKTLNLQISSFTYQDLAQMEALVILNNLHDLSFLIRSLEMGEKIRERKLAMVSMEEEKEKRDVERERGSEFLVKNGQISCLR